jgi:hypothetical protein
VVKKFIISGYFTEKNIPKIGEVKLSSCGLQKKIVIAELRSCGCEATSLKSCRIAIAEVLPSRCGIVIAGSKKKLRMPTSDEN